MYRLGNEIGFIAHPRTASRTTRDLFMELGATKHGGHHNIDEPTCKNIMQKGGVIACTVRNIFDVVVSWYYNQHFDNQGNPLNPDKEIPTFSDYILKELVPKPRHRWFQTPIFHYGLPFCKIRLRYETLEEDMSDLLECHDFDMPTLGYVGKSVNKTYYRDYYDMATRRAVEERWADDLYLTGYEF